MTILKNQGQPARTGKEVCTVTFARRNGDVETQVALWLSENPGYTRVDNPPELDNDLGYPRSGWFVTFRKTA